MFETRGEVWTWELQKSIQTLSYLSPPPGRLPRIARHSFHEYGSHLPWARLWRHVTFIRVYAIFQLHLWMCARGLSITTSWSKFYPSPSLACNAGTDWCRRKRLYNGKCRLRICECCLRGVSWRLYRDPAEQSPAQTLHFWGRVQRKVAAGHRRATYLNPCPQETW